MDSASLDTVDLLTTVHEDKVWDDCTQISYIYYYASVCSIVTYTYQMFIDIRAMLHVHQIVLRTKQMLRQTVERNRR